MWIYEAVTREAFEAVKDLVEKYIVQLGGKQADVKLPYEQKTCCYVGDKRIENISTRPVFAYGGKYYRVDEVCFAQKPFVVIEVGSYDDLIRNVMEDAEPFAYDLTEDALLQEVKYSLEIEPYPETD